jgi:hypothetical protein
MSVYHSYVAFGSHATTGPSFENTPLDSYLYLLVVGPVVAKARRLQGATPGACTSRLVGEPGSALPIQGVLGPTCKYRELLKKGV